MRILTTLMLSLATFSVYAGGTAPNQVPEPGTLALLGLAAVVGLVAHKRRK